VACRIETARTREHFPARAETAETAHPQVFRLRYLLDTNVCIAVLNQKSPQIEARVVKELREKSELSVSSVSAFELWYGVAKSFRRESNSQKLTMFLSNWVNLIKFDDQDARLAGELRAQLESVGRPVGEYDLLIAGQALRHKMTLVTANAREFGRIKNLSWEDWTRS
jgi:tRNA(fMet)-specific endonuclease VapC